MNAPKLRGSGLARALVLLAAVACAAPAMGQQAQPKKKDTPPFLNPKEVKLKATVEPATARPGDTVTYKVTATIDEPWHIYAFAAEQPSEGPRSTQFDFFDPADLRPAKSWKPDREPTRKKEPAFPDLGAVEFYDETVTWSVPVTIPEDARPGKRTLRSQIYFQICSPTVCKPPVYITVPEAAVTVTGGPGGGGLGFFPAGRGALIGSLTVGVQAAASPAEAPRAAPSEPPAASPAAAPAPKKPANEVEATIERGLVPFLILSALHGLLAVLMPCVWPLVPITVNFFVKQSQAKKGGSTVGLAIAYSLAIIGVFTAIGLAVSVFFGATAATSLGNNPWLNLIFALAFIAFGLSLLGLFEIRLPSSWLNASAQAEGRGGLVGVIFMAVTLTITSFTCTAPLVGSLLVMASRGAYFYPTVGLLVFSTVLSLPFLVLALSPSLMNRMPRSGDWMNSVKVVGGLLEIGAAFKFLNIAEVNFRGANRAAEAIFDAQLTLAIWVVLALVCGLYLLGLFRTDHDHEEVKVGPGRLVIGCAFLSLALYLAPALFGNPPRSSVYALLANLLPPDAAKLDANREVINTIHSQESETRTLIASQPVGPDAPARAAAPAVAADFPDVPVKATSDDPAEALRQERTVHGVSWGLSYDQAVELAKERNKPVLIDFTGVNCVNCRTMESTVMPKEEVKTLLRQFVTVQLYTDTVPIATLSKDTADELALKNLEFEYNLVSQTTSPHYVIVNPKGEVLEQISYTPNPSAFAAFLRRGLETYAGQAPRVASK